MNPDDFSDWAALASTAVTAIATGVLAWVTWLLMRSTDRMAAATSDPSVVVSIEPGRWSFIHLELVIENAGSGPAYDVRVNFDPPLMRDADTDKPVPMPMNAISVLRPRQALRNMIGTGGVMLDQVHQVTISWKNKPKAKHRQEVRYQMSLLHYKGLIQLGGGDPLVKLAREAEKMTSALQAISKGRLQMDTFNQEDRDREMEDHRKRMEKWNEVHAVQPQLSSPQGNKSEGQAPDPDE